MDPILSNQSPTRFLFGTFEQVNDDWIFAGSVIRGSDFTYDPETGAPVGGTIGQMTHETRSETAVLETHGSFSGFSANVARLNMLFDGLGSPWFSADRFQDGALQEADDAVIWTGGAGDDSFAGGSRDDSLHGMDGNDSIITGDGVNQAARSDDKIPEARLTAVGDSSESLFAERRGRSPVAARGNDDLRGAAMAMTIYGDDNELAARTATTFDWRRGTAITLLAMPRTPGRRTATIPEGRLGQ